MKVKILLALFSTIFTLGVLEVGLRVLKLPNFSPEHQPCVYEQDAEIGYRYVADSADSIHRHFEIDTHITINSQGWRDVEHTLDKPDDVTRVIAIGDSFTAAMHVPLDQTWPRLLEAQLNEALPDKQWEVINLGLDGTGTDVHLQILRENVAIYQPDYVVLAFFENDIGDIEVNRTFRDCYKGNVLLFQTDEQKEALRRFIDEQKPSGLMYFIYDKSFVARGFLTTMARFRPNTFPNTILLTTNFLSPSRIGLEATLQSDNPRNLNTLFAEFDALAAQHNFTLLTTPIPAKNDIEASRNALLTNLDASHPSIISVDIEPLEAERDVLHTDLYWRYDDHFNALGNELFSIIVTDALIKQVER